MNRRSLAACSAALVLVASAGAQAETLSPTSSASDTRAPVTGKPEVGTFAFDLDGMDRSVSPGDEFVRYAIGKWIDTTEIPPDRSSIRGVVLIREQTSLRVRDIVEEAAKANAPEGSGSARNSDFSRASRSE
jgi:putative endopeptidase